MTIQDELQFLTCKHNLTQDQITAVCIDPFKMQPFPNAPQNWIDTSPNHGKPYHIGTFEQLVGQAQSADEYVYVVRLSARHS